MLKNKLMNDGVELLQKQLSIKFLLYCMSTYIIDEKVKLESKKIDFDD